MDCNQPSAVTLFFALSASFALLPETLDATWVETGQNRPILADLS